MFYLGKTETLSQGWYVVPQRLLSGSNRIDGGGVFERHGVPEGLIEVLRFDDASHHLRVAGLGDIAGELHRFRLQRPPELIGDLRLDLVPKRFARYVAGSEDDEYDERFTLDLVRDADHRRFLHRRV